MGAAASLPPSANPFAITSINYKANAFSLCILLHLPFLFTILSFGLLAVLMLGLQSIAPTVGEVIGSTIAILIASLSFSAIVACQSALTYIDGQCRLEALDLRMMAQEMGLAAEMAQVFRANAVPAQMNSPMYNTTPGSGATDYLASAPPAPGAPYPDYSAPPPAFESAAAVQPSTPPMTDATVEASTEPHLVPEDSPEETPATAEVADAE